MEVKFFLDTYALIEIIRGNPAYKKFEGEELFTSILNLYELHYILLKSGKIEEAKAYFFSFRGFLIEIKDDHIFSASAFKLQNKTASYADCLGYSIALLSSMKFLTGDRLFEGLENVEFVK